MKTAELEGAALDAAVAMADQRKTVEIIDGRCHAATPMHRDGELKGYGMIPFQPSTRWCDGGPLIERERIAIAAFDDGWCGEVPRTIAGTSGWYYRGGDSWGRPAPTPLIAAMRAFVASRLGDDVELP